MDQIEYTNSLSLRRQAWKLLLLRTLLSPLGIAAVLGPLFLAVLGIHELWLTYWGFYYMGMDFSWYGWQTLAYMLLFLGTAGWMVWRIVAGNRRAYRRFLDQPEEPRRLVFSQHILRI